MNTLGWGGGALRQDASGTGCCRSGMNWGRGTPGRGCSRMGCSWIGVQHEGVQWDGVHQGWRVKHVAAGRARLPRPQRCSRRSRSTAGGAMSWGGLSAQRQCWAQRHRICPPHPSWVRAALQAPSPAINRAVDATQQSHQSPASRLSPRGAALCAQAPSAHRGRGLNPRHPKTSPPKATPAPCLAVSPPPPPPRRLPRPR